ncbi:tyrosine-type recombinase/integrase [Methylomonas paludis]|uniref:Tyrosine-type recombinase/integrase n=1 Tax=Methylomonas paludis TaxID=1173101 RepID=A0A975MKS3_9GAMM|nr:tyrosine-type recombinase/integrase [Methylomonas paludis]QWF69718.1 tyrosine-type recombinase/integrase [Methylomonas paludis]
MTTFTATQLDAIKPTAKTQDVTIEKLGLGKGCLLLRVQPDGKKVFYYRHFQEGKKRFVQIGSFNTKGKRNWDGNRGAEIGLSAAKDGARAIANIVEEHGDIISYESKQAEQEAAKRQQGSFADLLELYIQHLNDAGTVRVNKVEGTINKHVRSAFPRMLTKRANEITPTDIQTILAKLVQQGVTRQVNLLRGYLMASFNLAARHDNDPRRLASGSTGFSLTSNPVALVPAITVFNRAGERSLSKEELLLFLSVLETAPEIPAAFLKLLVALGGQRIEQLLRADWSDYDFINRVLTLRDGKGRPGLGVRDHLVPLTDRALEILEPLRQINSGCHPFTTIGGKRMDVGTPSKLVQKIAKQLNTDYDVPLFRGGDIRRTCETLLASIGVQKEVRAQLLSHGRSSGVQAKHYDRYAYLPEKLEALEKWEFFLWGDNPGIGS